MHDVFDARVKRPSVTIRDFGSKKSWLHVRVPTEILKRIPNTENPFHSSSQPPRLSNVHKGEPPEDVKPLKPQYRGSGTCEIEYVFCCEKEGKIESSEHSGRSLFQQRNESHSQANSSWEGVKVRSGVFPLKQINKIAFLPRIRNDESSASIGRIVITGKERSVINIDAEAPPSESSALTKTVVEGYP